MSKKTKYQDDFAFAPSLFISSGWDKSQLFGMNAAADIRHHVLRLTGGCGYMEARHAKGLRNLELALSGRDKDGVQRHKPYSGMVLSGGTRMVKRANPRVIVPGITEVMPAIEPWCPKAVTCGIVPKVSHLKLSPHGVVIQDNPKDEYVTILHPNQTSVNLLQPSADCTADYKDEARECARICDVLRGMHWGGCLTTFNGGGVTEFEIQMWAKLSQEDPDFWRIMLIKDSGRKTDEYAANVEFLEAHPSVLVCENDLDSMREKLQEHGALVPGVPTADELYQPLEAEGEDEAETSLEERPRLQ